MTEHLTMSGGGEHPSLSKVSGPWKWQCMCMWGHIPYKQRGQPDDMGTAALVGCPVSLILLYVSPIL